MIDGATIPVVTKSEYLVFVFVAAVGVLQLIAVGTHLNGLLFFRKRVLTYLFSLLAMGSSFYWFLVRDNRWDNVMRHTGLEGKQMFACFCLATFLALVFTLIVSSLISMLHSRGKTTEKNHRQGLDALKDMSYLEALRHSLKSKEEIDGSHR